MIVGIAGDGDIEIGGCKCRLIDAEEREAAIVVGDCQSRIEDKGPRIVVNRLVRLAQGGLRQGTADIGSSQLRIARDQSAAAGKFQLRFIALRTERKVIGPGAG